QPVAPILLVRVRAQVHERKYRDRNGFCLAARLRDIPLGTHAKSGMVAPLGDVDQHRIEASGSAVVRLEAFAKLHCLYAHDAVSARIEGGAAIEYLDAPDVLLQVTSAPCQFCFDHVAQESARARRRYKLRPTEDSFESAADGALFRPRRNAIHP